MHRVAISVNCASMAMAKEIGQNLQLDTSAQMISFTQTALSVACLFQQQGMMLQEMGQLDLLISLALQIAGELEPLFLNPARTLLIAKPAGSVARKGRKMSW